MKLSKNDLRILMAIRKEDAPMANYKIARLLGVSPAQTHKRLVILAREHVLHEIDGYPKFYTFNLKNKVQNLMVVTVECPKCEMMHIIHSSQTTVQCECLTKSNRRTRFYVFNERVRSIKALQPNGHKIDNSDAVI